MIILTYFSVDTHNLYNFYMLIFKGPCYKEKGYKIHQYEAYTMPDNVQYAAINFINFLHYYCLTV